MRRMKLSLILLAAFLVAAYAVYRHPYLVGAQPGHAVRSGQQVSPASVTTSPPDMVEGATHPELIPDPIAYRLFFLTVAEPPDATDAQLERERAYLEKAGLEGDDIQSAIDLLASFKTEYDDLVKRYNDSVVTASKAGVAPDLATFLSQQDDLVESTREALESALSTEGAARLATHVQREKRNMRMAKEAQ